MRRDAILMAHKLIHCRQQQLAVLYQQYSTAIVVDTIDKPTARLTDRRTPVKVYCIDSRRMREQHQQSASQIVLRVSAWKYVASGVVCVVHYLYCFYVSP